MSLVMEDTLESRPGVGYDALSPSLAVSVPINNSCLTESSL
jgi:hypothetical protein